MAGIIPEGTILLFRHVQTFDADDIVMARHKSKDIVKIYGDETKEKVTLHGFDAAHTVELEQKAVYAKVVWPRKYRKNAIDRK